MRKLLKATFVARTISLSFENLTSKTSFLESDNSKVILQEVGDPIPSITFLVTTPATVCAQGHQLKLKATVKDGEKSVVFLATGQVLEVERIEMSLRIVFNPVQFDSVQWKNFLSLLNATANDVQNIFRAMKD